MNRFILTKFNLDFVVKYAVWVYISNVLKPQSGEPFIEFTGMKPGYKLQRSEPWAAPLELMDKPEHKTIHGRLRWSQLKIHHHPTVKILW